MKEWQCPDGRYHIYKERNNKLGKLKEKCIRCGDVQLYEIDGNNNPIDENKWALYNRRRLLQPWGEMKKDFIKEYGNPFSKATK